VNDFPVSYNVYQSTGLALISMQQTGSSHAWNMKHDGHHQPSGWHQKAREAGFTIFSFERMANAEVVGCALC
jgi:hypothetical protein